MRNVRTHVLCTALVAATAAVRAFAKTVEVVEADVALLPEEPEVHEAPRPKRGHERFRMEPRNLSMKMRSRR